MVVFKIVVALAVGSLMAGLWCALIGIVLSARNFGPPEVILLMVEIPLLLMSTAMAGAEVWDTWSTE